MNIYVGNLNYKTTEEQVRELFGTFGAITSSKLIKDFNGQSRGFAFVEMDDSSALEAIEKMNGAMFMDKQLQVNEARPKTEGGPRGGGGGYQGNRGGGGGYQGNRSGGGGGGGYQGGNRSGGGGYQGNRGNDDRKDSNRSGDKRDFDRGGGRDFNRNDRDDFNREDKRDFRKRY